MPAWQVFPFAASIRHFADNDVAPDPNCGDLDKIAQCLEFFAGGAGALLLSGHFPIHGWSFYKNEYHSLSDCPLLSVRAFFTN